MKIRLFAATGILAILLSLLLVGCGINEHDKNRSPGESSKQTNAAAAKTLDEPVARNIMMQDSAVTVIPEKLKAVDYGFIFQKTRQARLSATS